MMTRESWTEYVQRISAGHPRSAIARAAEVHVSGLSRWINGTSTPRAEKVVAFARGLHQSPVEALIAAGYLDPTEVDGVIEVVRSRTQLSDAELLIELGDRLAQRPPKGDVDDITGRLARPTNFGEGLKDDKGLG